MLMLCVLSIISDNIFNRRTYSSYIPVLQYTVSYSIGMAGPHTKQVYTAPGLYVSLFTPYHRGVHLRDNIAVSIYGILPRCPFTGYYRGVHLRDITRCPFTG